MPAAPLSPTDVLSARRELERFKRAGARLRELRGADPLVPDAVEAQAEHQLHVLENDAGVLWDGRRYRRQEPGGLRTSASGPEAGIAGDPDQRRER
jgi:hypothetical protein